MAAIVLCPIYEDIPNGLYGNIYTSVIIIISLLILVSNILLINGILKSRKRRKYTTNEKLVLLLSCSDIMVGLVHIPLQVALIQKGNELACITRFAIGFWMVFPLAFSSTIVLIMSIERFFVVLNDSKCCGRSFKGIYFIPIIVFDFLISCGLGIWFMYSTRYYNFAVLHFCIPSYLSANLLLILAINTSLLVGTKKKLRCNDIQVDRHMIVEKQLSKTMTIISFSLTIAYIPLVASYYYFASRVRVLDFKSISSSTKLAYWALVIFESNSVFNALIYVGRSSRISRIYTSYIHNFVGSMSK